MAFFASFSSFRLIVHIKFAYDWIRTADLWCWKRPLQTQPYLKIVCWFFLIYIKAEQCNLCSKIMEFVSKFTIKIWLQLQIP